MIGFWISKILRSDPLFPVNELLGRGSKLHPFNSRMAYPKPCKRCERMYQPNSQSSKICEVCFRDSYKKRAAKFKEQREENENKKTT